MNNQETQELPTGVCSLCGRHSKIKCSDDVLGNVCDNCEGDMWRKKSRQRKRNAMHNIAKRMKITHRIEFINEGTCLLDERVYYYAQKRKARVKGEQKYYQMRGFKHFVEVFGS